MSNLVVWANIPVVDLERATLFYSTLLGIDMEELPGYGGSVSVPVGGDNGDSGFNLLEGADFGPCAEGVRIVFDAKGDIEAMAARAEAAGGKVIQAPMQMGPIGTFAQIMDSEGNIISLKD